MLCTSCNKQSHELHAYKSTLFKEMNVFLCNTCKEQNLEPRSLIIIYGQIHGPMSVAEYITNRRYLGADILAKELMKK